MPAPRPTGPAPDLLDTVLASPPTAFALLHRPSLPGPPTLEVLVGDIESAATLAEIPLPPSDGPDERAQADGLRHEVLALIPYRQIAERGFACIDDGTPLLAMTVTDQDRLPLSPALDRLPNESVKLSDAGFDVGDEEYARTAERVIADEIGWGQGSNFVIKRSYVARLEGYDLGTALSFFARLTERESGAYWTFLVHTGERTLVGASPERHVSLDGGIAVMNPISGTLRYPPAGPTRAAVERFLADRKETDELHMVVDEELKMMARFCEGGGRVVGPYLKEMARLAHTEYLIEGPTARDPREILRESMFAPTVTGSPIENACRVITRHEHSGRGYYSGVAALIGRDPAGDRTLDSAILIRTADIDAHGTLRIGVGATLVRHSDPASEAEETKAKAAGLLDALTAPPTPRNADPTDPADRTEHAAPVRAARFGGDPGVRAALARRNEDLSGFWLAAQDERVFKDPVLDGRELLVVDAEDTFTSMIAHQLAAAGLRVSVRRHDEEFDLPAHDLVVLGPGPGDPEAADDPRIGALRALTRELLARRRPFLAVCLSHQVLSTELGLPLVRRDEPNQGAQKTIDLFGSAERVGFYNTFAARCPSDEVRPPGRGPVRVARDPGTGEVHALRGPGFASLQFHAESVLTVGGPRILTTALKSALGEG